MDIIDFTVMGFDGKASEYLNWCMQYRGNLEFIRNDKVFEHFVEKKGNANLSFVEKSTLMSINKSLFSYRK